ncbi:hypothetical protein BH11BAC7_BH11BAC7_22140 [soil metagenome]
MKKLYTAVAILTMAFSANAQSSLRTSSTSVTGHPAPHAPGQVIHVTPPSVQAQFDTIFLFDGSYTYDWNSTLPASYSIATEDIDGLSMAAQMQPIFGNTSDFVFFYDLDSTSPYQYGHPDTVFFAGTTSYFNPAAQANNWLEFGPITIPASGATLHWAHNMPDGNYRDGYQVLVSPYGQTYTDFIDPPVFDVNDMAASTAGDTVNFPQTVFAERAADISYYAGQDVYIAFHHDANDMFILYLTNFLITEGPLAVVSPEANGLTLNQNMPNPANGNTVINYTLANNSDVLFNITDVTGKVVYTENINNQSAGSHRVDINTNVLANGIYFYSMTIGGQQVTRKMTVANN